jgi:YidC/Oxa1 family membrane protein insertase
MDRNLFLAIALSILVYAGWFGWVDKHAPPPPAGLSPAASAPSRAAEGEASAPSAEPTTAVSPAAARAAAEAPRVSFETAQGQVQLSADGASIAGYKFHGPLGTSEIVLSPQPGLFATWPGVNFRAQNEDGQATFVGRQPSGATLEKTFKFDPSGGWNTLTLRLSNPTPKPIRVDGLDLRIGPGLGTVEGNTKDLPSQWRAIEYLPSEQAADKVKPGKPAKPGWLWAGVDDRYFAAVAEPAAGTFPQLDVQGVEINGKTAPLAALSTGSVELAPGASKTYEVRFFIGPKDYARLKALGDGLQHAVDFGFFGALGLIVYKCLGALDKVTGNYGWAIILLTVCIQGLTFPLTFKSLQAAASMRRLQPKIKVIQDRYKDDPKRMNVEMMQLYKQSGTNPLGGCLPMLLQLPIFWALYAALRNAWELHGAPFIFWIKDLSAHDPYYVLPILMGGIMFLQQKSSPATPDPQQQQMMQFMPIIFTFMFLNFPTGLVLYWMTNSSMSLLLQLALKKKLEVA